MKRRILLVDDEVAVLLTMKAILEISGFEAEVLLDPLCIQQAKRVLQLRRILDDAQSM